MQLHEYHGSLGARFTSVNGMEVATDYGDALAEHAALRENAGVLDLSFRGRACLTGADRVRFLHGQVTNDVKRLRVGAGCYAALVTAKGRMVGDLNIFALLEELLLDFEPGFTRTLTERLEKYMVADDVQVVDVAPHYGLLSVQGPKAEAVVRTAGWFAEIPAQEFDSVKISDATLGEVYLMNHPRLSGECFGLRWQPRHRMSGDTALPVETPGISDSKAPLGPRSAGAVQDGFDLFVPSVALAAVAHKLIATAKSLGGRACGWTAFETARIETGIPRFGVDMDETNIPLECGIETRAVSYNKGCYIGQEVINRIHSIGHVNRELVRLRLADDLKPLPLKGDKLFHAGKEVGRITSAVASPALKANLALGYVRREVMRSGARLTLQSGAGETLAEVLNLPK